MNVQITLDNLEILNSRFDGKELKPAQEAAKGFITDGIETIKALGNLVLKHEDTIAKDFRLQAINKIEYKQKDIKHSKLKQKVLSLEEEIKQLKEVNENLMNEL